MTDWQQFAVEMTKGITPIAASIVSFFLGWFLNGKTDERKERALREREQQGRVEARELERGDRRDNFELEVLKELHVALRDYARSELVLIWSLEGRAYEDGTFPPGARFGDEENQANLLQTQNLARLKALVLDDEIRTAVEQTMSEFASALLATNRANSHAARDRGLMKTAEAQDLVGARVRLLYGSDDRH